MHTHKLLITYACGNQHRIAFYASDWADANQQAQRVADTAPEGTLVTVELLHA